MIRHQLPAASPVPLTELLRAAVQALASPSRGRAALSEHLEERFPADRVVLTGSGTQALQLALELARDTVLGPSGVVAMPAYSCYDLVSAAVGAEVGVAFYDLDPVTLSPDADSVRQAVAMGAKAIVAGNLFGFPIDWTQLREIARAGDILLIEDASQGLGSSWQRVDSGALGDMSVLSFGRGKGWTGGAGGALLLRGRGALEARAAGGEIVSGPGPLDSARAFATCLALWTLGRPRLYWLPALIPALGLGETVYDEPEPVMEMPAYSACAAVNVASPSLSTLGVRRSLAVEWNEVLDGRNSGGLSPCTPAPGGEAGFLRFPVLAEREELRSQLVKECRSVGVAPGYPRSLPELGESQAILGDRAIVTPGASQLARLLLTLPTHPFVRPMDVARVLEALTGPEVAGRGRMRLSAEGGTHKHLT